jgi:uncharacterized protein Yka (UPF0111/DUF47 family)
MMQTSESKIAAIEIAIDDLEIAVEKCKKGDYQFAHHFLDDVDSICRALLKKIWEIEGD